MIPEDASKKPSRPIVEPHADMREMAATTMQIFIAFKEQGFNDNQALTLTITMITTGARGDK